MKKLIAILTIMLLFSCTKPEYRWAYSGKLTSIRVDDDGEYHFTTDNVTEYDVHQFSITIQRNNVIEPELPDNVKDKEPKNKDSLYLALSNVRA